MRIAKRNLALQVFLLVSAYFSVCQANLVLAYAGDHYDLLIIGSDIYKAQIEKFMEFKKGQGVASRFASVEHVNSSFDGLNLADRIHKFVTWEYTRSGIKYLLLVGDYEQIPAKYVYSPSYEEGVADFNYKPTDWYYGVPEWSESQIGLLMGNVPEIAVGRLPVKDALELENLISKIIDVEGEIKQGFFLVYSSLSVTVNPTLGVQYAYYDVERKPLAEIINSQVAYALTYAHGSPSALWAKGENGAWEKIMTCKDVEALETTYNIHFLAACFTGATDLQSESLARSLAVSPRGPALVIASSRIQTCDDSIISYFWRNFFETGDVGTSILKAIKEYLSDGMVFSPQKPRFQKYNLYLTKVVYGDVSWKVKNPEVSIVANAIQASQGESEVLKRSQPTEAVEGENVQPLLFETFYPAILGFTCLAFKKRFRRIIKSL